MKELVLEELEDVTGGAVLTAVAAVVAVGGAIYGAYQGGKTIGADIIKGMNAS